MDKPKWLEVAENELGQHEVAGAENPRILEYHATTTLHAMEDEVPWCASFVNWCIEQAGFKGTSSALAKSWLNWGHAIRSPVMGCVCVIRKKQKDLFQDTATGSYSGYHVAFWLAEKDNRVHLLGGNQSDQVKMSSFNLESYEIISYRMPNTGGYENV